MPSLHTINPSQAEIASFPRMSSKPRLSAIFLKTACTYNKLPYATKLYACIERGNHLSHELQMHMESKFGELWYYQKRSHGNNAHISLASNDLEVRAVRMNPYSF